MLSRHYELGIHESRHSELGIHKLGIWELGIMLMGNLWLKSFLPCFSARRSYGLHHWGTLYFINVVGTEDTPWFCLGPWCPRISWSWRGIKLFFCLGYSFPIFCFLTFVVDKVISSVILNFGLDSFCVSGSIRILFIV